MNKKIIGIFVCTLFIMSAFGSTLYSETVTNSEDTVTGCKPCLDKHEVIVFGRTVLDSNNIDRRITPEITYARKNPSLLNYLQPTVEITSPDDGAEVTDPYLA
ncbi:unnamed protein product, partial [marine sediment metagenome]